MKISQLIQAIHNLASSHPITPVRFVRMKEVLFILLGFFNLTGFSAFPTAAQTAGLGGCEQKYNFFMKAQFNDLFWIGESMGGNCMTSTLVQVLLEPDKEPQVIQLNLTDYNRWYWVESADGYLRRELVVELEADKECFVSRSSKMKVKPPAYNNEMMRIYREQLNSSCAETFNNAVGKLGVKLPKVTGREVELVYFHPKGLYFNYNLAGAYYFPDSQYLLVLTDQPIKCMGNNTNHGFMILKLTRKS